MNPNRDTQLLILLQSFNTFWAYYVQSDGELYSEESRTTAKHFLPFLKAVTTTDEELKKLLSDSVGDSKQIDDILERIRDWANGERKHPYENIVTSRFTLHTLLSTISNELIRRTGSSLPCSHEWSPHERDFSLGFVRWRSHLPEDILYTMPENLIETLSSSYTIAVLGDIRRSQDLMTYSPDPDLFTQNTIKFLTETRHLLNKHLGILDKFTGDGFLAYFNEEMCRKNDRDFLECFLSFVKEELEFAKVHFSDWSHHIRKVPEVEIGLALGADLGKIAFRDESNQLVAVGDAIVWSERMCSCAKANDIVSNNILWNHLEAEKNIKSTPRESKTKVGEPFMGYVLHIN